MKHKKVMLIALVIVAIAATAAVVWLNTKDETFSAKQPQSITGQIDGISNQCQADGVCGVTLDNGKTIITGCGLMAGGKTCKTYDQTKLKYGQQIEATVIQTDANTYTLECDTCTIRAGD